MAQASDTIQANDIVQPWGPFKKGQAAVALFVILLLTFLSYLPTLRNDFVYLDDDSHLLDNSAVRVLDIPHIKQIFTTTVSKVYVPLTFLSFAIEYHFFKYNPFIYHLDNLLLHMGVTSLVFCFALQVGLPLMAAFAAGLLFGIHPMHVESVCWVTERKDVLYSFFYMLTLSFYFRYLTKRKIIHYAATIVFGVFSILAKPMALSLPLILFVCDWFKKRRLDQWMFFDKIPHFLYVVPIAWITYSLNARIPGENIQSGALIWVWTCVFYIHKFFFPITLVPMYALPKPVVLTNIHYLSALGLLLLVVVSLTVWRRHRWLWFAALFYFFSIFFLLRYDSGVDKSIVADRFMYLPSLGICVLFGYWIDRIFKKIGDEQRMVRAILSLCLIFVTSLLAMKTYAQTKVWRGSIPFWSYVIEYYPDNAMAYGNRGEAYKDIGKYELAMADFNKSIEVDPVYVEGYNSRGQMYGAIDNIDAALEDFLKVIELRPHFDEAYNNIGVIYSLKKDPEKAVPYFEKALELDPHNIDAHYNIGNYYYNKGDFHLAFEHFQKVLDIDPRSAIGYNKRGLIYGIRKQYDLALDDLNHSIAIDPNKSEVYKNKGVILEHKKMFEEAIENYNKAIELNPKSADAYCFRGNVNAQMGRYGEAARDFGKALEIDSNHFWAKMGQNALIKLLTGQKMHQNIDGQAEDNTKIESNEGKQYEKTINSRP